MPLGRTIDSCTFKLRSWRPFGKTLGSDSAEPRAAAAAIAAMSGPYSKRVCRADRATSIPFNSVLDMSKLSLFDDDKPPSFSAAHGRRFTRKRRRRGGSRSVSGRSSDRRCRSISVSAANGTCSDFLMAAGSTDSSGELFWDARWVCDVSKKREEGNGGGEREYVVAGYGLFGNCDIQGNESGYGSEPGYKGDVELEYGDELDDDDDEEEEEEEEDRRALFWGDECGENTRQLEMVVENSLQKGHHRCRRKKHDLRMADALR